MHMYTANALAGASMASYYDNPYHSGELDYIDNLHVFEKKTCCGFVASNDELVILSFRGTNSSFKSDSDIIDSAKQWLRNLNIFQNDYDGIRVHAGFDEDITNVFNQVGNILLDHGGDEKPIFVTGHSAGGAIATLAAHRYRLFDLNIHSAYVFGSPRVGNRAFVENYAAPLFRIETLDDLVPHVPLPPLAMKSLDFIIETMDEMISPAFPNLIPSFADNFEYVHAGKLFFIDWDGDLVYSHTDSEIIEEVIKTTFTEIFDDDQPGLPGEPIPKAIMDTARAIRTSLSIGPQILNGTFEFLHHHPILYQLQCVRRLLGY